MNKETETVTYKGNVYQIGGVYEFSDDGVDWVVNKLMGVLVSGDLPFDTKKFGWKLIREVNYTIGTITPAPVELIDGAAYMFDYKDVASIGLYEASTLRFIQVNGFTCSSRCTNIRLMTVGSK